MTDVKHIMTPPFRLAFPDLWEAKLGFDKDKPPRYSCTMLFPPDQDLGAMKAMVRELVEEHWGPKWKEYGLRLPFKAAEDKSKYQGFEPGWAYIEAQSQTMPGVIDERKQDVEPGDPRIYAGCWCRATVAFAAYPSDKKAAPTAALRGVTVYLNNVMRIKDDERLDGRRSAADDFEEVEVEAEPESAGEVDPLS